MLHLGAFFILRQRLKREWRPTSDMENQLSDFEYQLALRCSKGERKAQFELYKHYYSEMMPVAMRYTDVKDDAAEILNDAFLKLFRQLEKDIPSFTLKGFLRKLVVNTAIDYFRANQKHQYHLDIENSTDLPEAANALDEMSYDEILQMIQKLPPAYKLCFNLNVMDGYQHNEIAAMLGISEGTSKSNVSKAKQKLQRMILINRQKGVKYVG